MLDFILFRKIILLSFQPYKYFLWLEQKYTRNCYLNGLSCKFVNLNLHSTNRYATLTVHYIYKYIWWPKSYTNIKKFLRVEVLISERGKTLWILYNGIVTFGQPCVYTEFLIKFTLFRNLITWPIFAQMIYNLNSMGRNNWKLYV